MAVQTTAMFDAMIVQAVVAREFVFLIFDEQHEVVADVNAFFGERRKHIFQLRARRNFNELRLLLAFDLNVEAEHGWNAVRVIIWFGFGMAGILSGRVIVVFHGVLETLLRRSVRSARLLPALLTFNNISQGRLGAIGKITRKNFRRKIRICCR